MAALAQGWMRFWFAPAPPLDLAICRMLFYGALLALNVGHDFSAWAGVSSAFWMPIWLFEHLGLPLLDQVQTQLLQAVWKLCLFGSCIGFLTRVSTMISFIFGCYLLGLPHNFGATYHYDALVVIVLGIMAFSRCGDTWSFDQFFSRGRRRNLTSVSVTKLCAEYTWPIRLVWMSMVLVFLAAGLSKVRHSGIDWILTENLANTIRANHYHIANADPLVTWGLDLAEHRLLYRGSAAVTVLLELSYPLALIDRRARWVCVPGMLIMLLAVRAVLGPTFETFLVCNVFWVPWDRLAREASTWSGHRPARADAGPADALRPDVTRWRSE
jgi:hypothetical protein